jgi:MFS family permease
MGFYVLPRIRTTSMVSDFGFTCDQHYQRSFFSASYMVGMLVGAFIIGIVSDRHGRLNAIALSSILLSCAGVLISFVGANQIALAFLRILTGMGGMVRPIKIQSFHFKSRFVSLLGMLHGCICHHC